MTAAHHTLFGFRLQRFCGGNYYCRWLRKLRQMGTWLAFR
jgi:hypothetical protein